MDTDETIRRLILENASTDQIRAAARAAGMRTLAEDGWRLVAQGITINGLAIEVAPVTRGNEPLHVHYERNVMGGPGAFVMVAETRRDFARALRAKMLREIA